MLGTVGGGGMEIGEEGGLGDYFYEPHVSFVT